MGPFAQYLLKKHVLVKPAKARREVATMTHPPLPLTAYPQPAYNDDFLNLMGSRFQANNICYLLDITFEMYLLAPQGWDRIAKHLNDGGGCRMEKGRLVMNTEKAGVCAWCERFWSARSGGLNKDDLCPECARNLHSPVPSLPVPKAVQHG